MMQSTLILLSVGSILSTVGATPLHSLRSRATVAIAGYDYAGCYSEVANHALNEKITYDDAMTLEICAASCADYTWWGVEYGRECYCGNTLHTGSVAVPEASCSFSCPGNAAETCGAGDHLTMYAKTGTVTPVSSTPAKYGSLGCYTEATTGRALSSASISNDAMTVENCAVACTGYSYFGVEYGRECYCGNTVQAGSVKDLDSACSYTCVGNSQESCGGDWHLGLYQFGAADVPADATITTFNRQGCYGETSPRALSEKSYFDDAMTVEKCATACAGYTYFGLEYGRECYCGNTILATSVTTDIQDSECNFPCPGDSTEHCGAGNRIDMYKFGPKTSSSSSLTLSSTSTLSSSSLVSSSSSSSTITSVAATTTSSSLASSSSSSSSSSDVSSSSSSPTPTSTSSSSSSSSSSIISSSSTSSTISSTSSSSSTTSSSSSSTFTTSSSTSSSIISSTSTSSTANPTPTSLLLVTARTNRPLIVVSSYVQYAYSNQAGAPVSVILAGGQPYLPDTPTVKLFVHQASALYGVMYFETAAQAATTNDQSITCSVSSAGVLSCLTANGFNTIWSCGAYLYFGKSTWNQAGCLATTLTLATRT